jgi:histidinol-phosphatase (PHP family)
VEIGYNPLAVEELKRFVRRFSWDWQGLSYHYYFDGRRHLNMVSRRRENMEALAQAGPDRVITDYLDGLIEAVGVLDCNVLCHLDAVMRHYPGVRFNRSHRRQIDLLLAAVRQRNMCLEINTSGFALRAEPYPGREIIGRALQLGIPLTAGSDAHHPEQVGRFFTRIPEFLASAG